MNQVTDRILKVFVDFDGTITKRDVGESMFLEFGDNEKVNEIIKDWLELKFNSIEMWKKLCSLIPHLDKETFFKFLDTIEIDEDFKEFINYCEEEGYEIKIVSDGFDLYINYILNRENLAHLEVLCNSLNYSADGELIPSFPFTDEECTTCANCKRNHVINFSSDDDYTVYIGNGTTDTCPVQYCDFVFAKSSLLRYCEMNRITFFPFNTFADVKTRLIELSNKKRLNKRHQAELKRREIYIQG